MIWTLTVDCLDARRLAAFWRLALGYDDAPPPSGFETWEAWFEHFEVPPGECDGVASLVDPDGVRPSLTFLQVPEAKSVKNRLHLDLRASGGRDQPQDLRLERIEAHVSRLVAAGGHVVRRDEVGGLLDHVVMQDPEGNELCVV